MSKRSKKALADAVEDVPTLNLSIGGDIARRHYAAAAMAAHIVAGRLVSPDEIAAEAFANADAMARVDEAEAEAEAEADASE